MERPAPIRNVLRIALRLNQLVERRTGIEPLLSTAAYSYGVSVPDWDWERIGLEIERVEAQLDFLPGTRVPYLEDMLTAFRMMAREGQGDDIPYAERVETYIQVPGERVPEEVIDGLHRKLSALLVEAGYPEDPADAIPQWRERQMVRGEELVEHGRDILARARARTNERVIALPEEHQVKLDFPENYPYRGYSDYSSGYQGHIFLNGDIGWELPSLKHVICHEAFPGHQTFSAVREWQYRAGEFPVEGTLYFSNTPMTPVNEGVAEIGQDMLGMIENTDDRIYDVYNRYCSANSTNLAFDCNADGMDQKTAVTELMERTYVSRVFAEKRYHFWTNPLWCTGFPHYWYGREFMRENYAKMKDNLSMLYEMVYGQPHSVRTLREAIQAYLRR